MVEGSSDITLNDGIVIVAVLIIVVIIVVVVVGGGGGGGFVKVGVQAANEESTPAQFQFCFE